MSDPPDPPASPDKTPANTSSGAQLPAADDNPTSVSSRAEEGAVNVERLPRAALREIIEQRYAGPIPPASELKAYDEIVPGAADRIIKMAEKEQTNRHAAAGKALDAEIDDTRRGQMFGLAIGITAIVSGTILGLAGHPAAGSLISLTALASLVTAFILGRSGWVKANADSEKAQD
ncbi:MAG: DUF2335 domain-containing protein [Gammaproteobacteria bacterium]